MVPYFGRYVWKQFIKNKPVKFGYKLWVATTPFNFILARVKMTSLIQIWGLEDLRLWAVQTRTDNFFTSPQWLRSLREKGIAVTDTDQLNRIENAQLKSIKEIEKLEKGSADVVTDDNTKIAFVTWKDSKVVTVISSNYGLHPTVKTKQYLKEKKSWVDIEQPQWIKNTMKKLADLIVGIKT